MPVLDWPSPAYLIPPRSLSENRGTNLAMEPHVGVIPSAMTEIKRIDGHATWLLFVHSALYPLRGLGPSLGPEAPGLRDQRSKANWRT